MVTKEALLKLALLANEDADAKAILDDALEERGETWETYARLMTFMPESRWLDLYAFRGRTVAAVLLFGDWCNTSDLEDYLNRQWFPYAERYADIMIWDRALGRSRTIPFYGPLITPPPVEGPATASADAPARPE